MSSIADSATSSVTNAGTEASRNTSGRGGRGGRGRGRGGRGGHGRGGTRRNRQTTFKGSTDDMNGNVFECHEEQTDRRQYAKTLEALQGYVKKNLKFADDLAPLFATTMTNPAIVRPTNEGVPGDPTDDMIFKEEIKEYVNRLRGMKDNMATIQAVLWGQCSESMKSKVKSIDGYDDRATANDCFWLLKQVKAVTLQFDQKRNGFLSIMDSPQGPVS
jgi:hypothetical protein